MHPANPSTLVGAGAYLALASAFSLDLSGCSKAGEHRSNCLGFSAQTVTNAAEMTVFMGGTVISALELPNRCPLKSPGTRNLCCCAP